MPFVWRRPRPLVGPKDPQYEEKLRQLPQLVAELHDDDTVVFQEEVEVWSSPSVKLAHVAEYRSGVQELADLRGKPLEEVHYLYGPEVVLGMPSLGTLACRAPQ